MTAVTGLTPAARGMRVLSFVQKPYDLLADLEYMHAAGIVSSALTAVIVGDHANCRSARNLCRKHGISYRDVPDPDLYGIAVAKLHARWIQWRRSLLVLKALLRPIAWLFWLRADRVAARIMRDVEADLILSDPWRSKCLYWAHVPGDAPIVLHDGGYSTLSYGLLPAFTEGGARALAARALSQQKPLMPAALRRRIVNRLPEQTPFFTCYPAPPGGDLKYPLVHHSYAYSKAQFRQKPVSAKALILGIPNLKHIDTYLARALREMCRLGLSGQTADIDYRFHPTDLNRSRLDEGYRKRIEEGVRARGMSFSYPAFSLEFDFLELETLPRLIVCYESSSLVWQQTMLAGLVDIVVLKDR